VEQSEANSIGGARGCESPCHGHRALPRFSHVYPNHLVCLHHLDHSIPLDLAMTTALLRALGIALC